MRQFMSHFTYKIPSVGEDKLKECSPFPAQAHINPMLKLAKLLHFKGGFHVTFVHTEYNHKRET
ncbi:putative 7-deoxyloganetin glucosyltransferase [Medicago truncatula]|nr:putative 7-deoxyloganetin glucosyltransferase [Medicago truncatula]